MATTTTHHHFVIREGLTEEKVSEELVYAIERFERNATTTAAAAAFITSWCANNTNHWNKRSFRKQRHRDCKKKRFSPSSRVVAVAAEQQQQQQPQFAYNQQGLLTETEASAELVVAIQKEQEKHGVSCDGCYRTFQKTEWLQRHQRSCQEWKELNIIRAHLRGEFGWGHIS